MGPPPPPAADCPASEQQLLAPSPATTSSSPSAGRGGGSSNRKCWYAEHVDWASLKHLEAPIPNYNGLTKCTWTPSAPPDSSPHWRMVEERRTLRNDKQRKAVILDSVLDYVGNTPMIRLKRFAEHHGLKCDLVGKCDFFSAGGSVKDRIGKRMIEEAERDGLIKVGDTLIEPTSGNTGVGLALAAAVKGYRMLITMPEKMSLEKVNMMKALGAEILRTPTEAAWNSPDSHIGLAMKLQKTIPNSIILDQYKNPANPMAHYEETAEEILEQCDGKVDMVVVAAGTGGTITGIARLMKERLPKCQVIGVDPRGSILAVPDSMNDEKRNESYFVEGIGYDFIPSTLDRSVVDKWVKSDDEESFRLARDLIRLEGLLCGGSSGAAMAGVLEAAKELKEGDRCVVVLADSSRNYMSKFLSDDWLIANEFMETGEEEDVGFGVLSSMLVSDLDLSSPVTATRHSKVSDVVDLMDSKGIDQVPIVEEATDSTVVGVVTGGNLASSLESGRVQMDDTVEESMFRQFRSVRENSRLAVVSRLLDVNPYVFVTRQEEKGGKEIVTGVISRIDLLKVMKKTNV
eukprot:GHVS01069343.1.p1 GENE.GHVS01069343.1~~GHVS01069343.1.p1  ORF type:complete len:573 (+),score=117.25 GHVS01069343.1:104-1822(+)